MPDSFAHPAKMDSQLLLWIVNRYSEAGETILDPMAGSGTTMLSCTLGRNVVLVELEEKFCKMMRDNWGQVKMRPQLGSTMGECQIIQGDARQLEGLLAGARSLRGLSGVSNPRPQQVDKCIFSPPFAGNKGGLKSAEGFKYGDDELGKRMMGGIKGGTGSHPDNIDSLPYGEIDKCIFSPPFKEQMLDTDWMNENYPRRHRGKHNPKEQEPENIGNLPYGQIDKIVTSPPYTAFGASREGEKIRTGKSKIHKEKSLPTVYTEEQTDNIGNKSYGNIDSIITSPPYEGSVSASTGGERDMASARQREKRLRDKGYDPVKYQGGVGRNLEVDFQYSKDDGNIGNLKSDTYLQAMLQVYQQCYKVLKPEGLMILVTKNFIRNKQVIRLDLDTIKLCEQAGFSFLERHYRKLPSQSFWRVIYSKKHPEVEQINFEDVVVFKK